MKHHCVHENVLKPVARSSIWLIRGSNLQRRKRLIFSLLWPNCSRTMTSPLDECVIWPSKNCQKWPNMHLLWLNPSQRYEIASVSFWTNIYRIWMVKLMHFDLEQFEHFVQLLIHLHWCQLSDIWNKLLLIKIQLLHRLHWYHHFIWLIKHLMLSRDG